VIVLLCTADAEFLEALRRFYDWETSVNVYPEKVTDLVAWKLILRLLRRSLQTGPPHPDVADHVEAG